MLIVVVASVTDAKHSSTDKMAIGKRVETRRCPLKGRIEKRSYILIHGTGV